MFKMSAAGRFMINRRRSGNGVCTAGLMICAFLGWTGNIHAQVTDECMVVPSGDSFNAAVSLPFIDVNTSTNYGCLDNNGNITTSVTLAEGVNSGLSAGYSSFVVVNTANGADASINSIIVHSLTLDSNDPPTGVGDSSLIFSSSYDYVNTASINSIAVDGTVVAQIFFEGDGGANSLSDPSLTHVGSITVEATAEMRLANEFVWNHGGSVIDEIKNYGIIRSDQSNVIYNYYAGSKIDRIENYGSIIGEFESVNAIYNGEDAVITSIKNYGFIGPCDYSAPGNLPVAGDTCPAAGDSPRFAAIGNAGTIGTLSNASYLTYEGYLPENYNIIISETGYGQLEVIDEDFYTPYPNSTPLGDFVFGLESGSSVTQLVYGGVLTNVSSENLANISGSEVTGVYDGATWHLVETATAGVWDLVFDSLPVYNPTAEETAVIALAARSSQFAQQFDNSRLVTHLSASRDRTRNITATADVVYESEQEGNASSMSTTVGGSTIFGIIQGAWADFGATGGSEAFRSSAWGGTFGAEHHANWIDATVGVFGSYSAVRSDGSDSGDDLRTYGAGVLASKDLGLGVWFDTYGAYYQSNHGISRGTGTDAYDADAAGRTWSAYARLSYGGWRSSSAALTPYLSANYVSQWTDGYEEDGTGSAALHVGADETSNVLTYLGANLEAELPIGGAAMLMPKLDLSWVHLMEDGERTVLASYVGATDGVSQLIAGSDQDYARIQASMAVRLEGGFMLEADYATQWGYSGVDQLHELRLEASYSF